MLPANGFVGAGVGAAVVGFGVGAAVVGAVVGAAVVGAVVGEGVGHVIKLNASPKKSIRAA
jgi:hypothetical protein